MHVRSGIWMDTFLDEKTRQNKVSRETFCLNRLLKNAHHTLSRGRRL
ncbi:MAG: hypothetical protein CSYNP_02954 [Syntrophus sp. SKADARSKE-3]|nr:hypothetical protein [Syntrophus sp. SKADARSKE-3]